jgi:hypothetical protein
MSTAGSRICLGLCLVLLAAADARGQAAEPFKIRNLNPLVAVFGLPAWDTVTPGTTVAATVEVANHYRLSRRVNDVLILDGETLRTTLALSRGFGERWEAGLELPHYRHSGGSLDDLIDGWHSVFGLPDGGRNNRPEDDLWFVLGDQTGTFFELDRRRRGLGDIQVKLARTLGRDGGFVVQAVTLRSRPFGFYWGAGLLRAGEPDLIDFEAESLVYTGVLGGSWQIRPRFGVKAQLDFHGPFFNTPLEELGEKAMQATIGGWLSLTERSTFEFAVVEDVAVSTAPDVVLHVAARWLW